MVPSSSCSSSTARLHSSDAFKVQNVCCLLTRRSQGFYIKDAGVVYRKNMGILRKLICQESTTFKNVWTMHSTSPIVYQSGKVYFDNYRCCVSSVTREPRIIYQMPACPKSEKIEDALLLECPVGEVLPSLSDYKPSLAVLTAHNWLFRICANTGEILEKVYLAAHCKFRYLRWDSPQEVMTVKSCQQKLPPVSRQAASQQLVLFYLAVFRVLPLAFIGMLQLDKKIFGNTMTDVAMSHGLLIVTHSTGLVRLYSFQTISEQFMQHQVDLGQEYDWNGQVGIVGKYPFGVPCNIKITGICTSVQKDWDALKCASDTPDLLFEVSSLESAFQIGGYPWHYIITPNKERQRAIFHICSLEDHTLAKNGIQDMKCYSLEPDWIVFHPDSSGRIIHVGPNLIKVLKLKEIENNPGQQEVTEDFIIEASRENHVNSAVTVTASGRVVKKRFDLLDDDPEQETFKVVDYEDELNLLSVVAVTEIGSDGVALLHFHCNEQGTRLKTIPFLEPWDVTYSHDLYFDRNVVLHIEEKPNRIFSCYVYQMVCSSSGEQEDKQARKGERRVYKKLGRSFECF